MGIPCKVPHFPIVHNRHIQTHIDGMFTRRSTHTHPIHSFRPCGFVCRTLRIFRIACVRGRRRFSYMLENGMRTHFGTHAATACACCWCWDLFAEAKVYNIIRNVSRCVHYMCLVCLRCVLISSVRIKWCIERCACESLSYSFTILGHNSKMRE